MGLTRHAVNYLLRGVRGNILCTACVFIADPDRITRKRSVPVTRTSAQSPNSAIGWYATRRTCTFYVCVRTAYINVIIRISIWSLNLVPCIISGNGVATCRRLNVDVQLNDIYVTHTRAGPCFWDGSTHLTRNARRPGEEKFTFYVRDRRGRISSMQHGARRRVPSIRDDSVQIRSDIYVWKNDHTQNNCIRLECII